MAKIEAELSQETAQALSAEAARAGLTVSDYVAKIIEARSGSSNKPTAKSKQRAATIKEHLLEFGARHGDSLPDIPMEQLRREYLYEDA